MSVSVIIEFLWVRPSIRLGGLRNRIRCIFFWVKRSL